MKKYYIILIFVLACMQISYANDFQCNDFMVKIQKSPDNLYHWKLHKHNQYELIYEDIKPILDYYKFTKAYLYNIETNEVINKFEFCMIEDDPIIKGKKYILIDLDNNLYNLNRHSALYNN